MFPTCSCLICSVSRHLLRMVGSYGDSEGSELCNHNSRRIYSRVSSCREASIPNKMYTEAKTSNVTWKLCNLAINIIITHLIRRTQLHMPAEKLVPITHRLHSNRIPLTRWVEIKQMETALQNGYFSRHTSLSQRLVTSL
jgi:hypothetical protein